MTDTPKLIGIGSALVDQLAYVPDEFLAAVDGAKGGMELIEGPDMDALIARLPEPPFRVPGGSAANTIVGAARLGMKTGLLTKIGDDEPGRYYREAVQAAGVDDHAFKVSEDVASGSCISLVTPDSERTMRTFLGASATLAPENISRYDFQGYSHAHVEGYLLFNEVLLMHVLQCAEVCKCLVSLDLAAPEVVRANLEKLPRILAEYVDIVLANEQEAAEFAGTDDPETALQRLGELCSVAVVKLGKRGALILEDGKATRVAACTVQAVDTTGAGDLWAAGFLYGHANNLGMQASGELGARVAAEVVQITGAAIPEETWVKLREPMAAEPAAG